MREEESMEDDDDGGAKNIAPAIYHDNGLEVLVDDDKDLDMGAIACVHCGRRVFTFSQFDWPTAIMKLICPDCGRGTYVHMGASIVSGHPFPPLPDRFLNRPADEAGEDSKEA